MSARIHEFKPSALSRPATARTAGVQAARSPRKRLRIALYSHDTQGLGHVRRNLLISRALCRNGATPIILLLSGLREAAAFAMPPGVDCLTLPSLGKGADGRYFPRSLDVPMDDLINVRRRAIAGVLHSFQPDVLIVDKVPLGVFDELLPSLEYLRKLGTTRVVLGLREVLDDPATVRKEWTAGGYESAIRTYFHRIWIYGDPMVYDSVQEYGFSPDIASMARYCGYLNPRDVETAESPAACSPEAAGGPRHIRQAQGPLFLCLVGGGRDGLPVAEAFLQAHIPGEGALVTGPLMPEQARTRLQTLALDRPNVRICKFVTDPCPLIRRAARVIAMGGYNTICEILAYNKHALIVPRTTPRTEQLIRARRFAELGLLDMLPPDRLSPAALSAWLAQSNGRPKPASDLIDFNGVRRLPELLAETLAPPRSRKEHADVAI